MNNAILEQEALAAPTQVHRARSETAEIVAPFQYYTAPGEAIYALDFANHEVVARLLLHFDAEGVLLAQTLVSDSVGESSTVATWLYSSRADLDGLSFVDADFGTLMAEMHQVTSQDGSQLYDGGQLATLRELGRETPIVIGGCGRSGTTLLLSMLGAHPAVLAFPEELYAFYPYPFRPSLLIDALAAAQADDSWRRWCEKTPKNVRAFERIHDAFGGDVHLVHIVRDGRDVVTSHHPNASQRYYIDPERWVADVRAGLEHAGKALLLRYEDLVRDPQTSLVAVCEHIGEPFDERLLSFERHSSVQQNKAWEGGAAQALHREHLERWRAPEHEGRVAQFLATPGAESLMQELGFL